MKYEIKPYSIQELGKRENQEDSLFPPYGSVTADDRLFVLCDGMGGHEKGEVASSTVCETISSYINARWHTDEVMTDELVQEAIEAAFDALDDKDDGAEKKMGTTMTFLCLHPGGATVAHIGDSRVYQIRPAKNGVPAHIVFHTRDHSLVNDLIKIGEITEEEARNHPQKNVITRAMLPCQKRRSKADVAHLTDIQDGDYFYMCSDGMLEQTSDDNLIFIVSKPDITNEEKVEMLRNVTADNKDNHTAHLIYINKVEGNQEALSPTAVPFSIEPSKPSQSVNAARMKPITPKNNRIKATSQHAHAPKDKKTLYLILAFCALVLVAAIAIVCLFVFKPSDERRTTTSNSAKIEKKDSLQKQNADRCSYEEQASHSDFFDLKP